MTLVEINNTKGAFCFKTFKGKKSVEDAQKFCRILPTKSKSLSAYIKTTVNI